jgi:hypothetical protein
MTESEYMKAPFPYFGGKRALAPEIWRRFGNVPNYVEPFAGSLAVLLSRPHPAKTETVNDLDCYLSNFWRAVQADPEAVASWADYPVSEIDILSRHDWLLAAGASLRESMRSDPLFYDTQVAGWWAWGACSWIGGGWCVAPSEQLPHLGDAGMGINRKLPHLGDAGRGAYIREYMAALSARLRDVRIACGDWSRVLAPSVTHRHGVTAVFLDPPYGEGAMDYSAGGNRTGILQDVAAWAVSEGNNPLMRIALCGYEGAVDMPASWSVHRWKARGGYGSQGEGDGRVNAGRECVWFSPHCLGHQTSLFDMAA